jgi:hypothetical protein
MVAAVPAGDNGHLYATVGQGVGQVIGTDGTSGGGCIEMLMKKQDFHDAKKLKNSCWLLAFCC